MDFALRKILFKFEKSKNPLLLFKSENFSLFFSRLAPKSLEIEYVPSKPILYVAALSRKSFY